MMEIVLTPEEVSGLQAKLKTMQENLCKTAWAVCMMCEGECKKEKCPFYEWRGESDETV